LQKLSFFWTGGAIDMGKQKGNTETENQVVRQTWVKNALFAIFAR
jgi:hypothetical protein